MDTKTIGIFNNKGGVAKTTSIINLAYSMQKNGHKVLVVDCDTQENCFSFFLTGRMTDMILPTDYENISHTTWSRYLTIPEEVKETYRYILFDLPPTLTDDVSRA